MPSSELYDEDEEEEEEEDDVEKDYGSLEDEMKLCSGCGIEYRRRYARGRRMLSDALNKDGSQPSRKWYNDKPQFLGGVEAEMMARWLKKFY